MEMQREIMEGTNKSGYEHQYGPNDSDNTKYAKTSKYREYTPHEREPFLSHKNGEEPGETEEFVDANEHGSSGYSDSEMEVVGETPISGQ
jgi:hypothetical protein